MERFRDLWELTPTYGPPTPKKTDFDAIVSDTRDRLGYDHARLVAGTHTYSWLHIAIYLSTMIAFVVFPVWPTTFLVFVGHFVTCYLYRAEIRNKFTIIYLIAHETYIAILIFYSWRLEQNYSFLGLVCFFNSGFGDRCAATTFFSFLEILVFLYAVTACSYWLSSRDFKPLWTRVPLSEDPDVYRFEPGIKAIRSPYVENPTRLRRVPRFLTKPLSSNELKEYMADILSFKVGHVFAHGSSNVIDIVPARGPEVYAVLLKWNTRPGRRERLKIRVRSCDFNIVVRCLENMTHETELRLKHNSGFVTYGKTKIGLIDTDNVVENQTILVTELLEYHNVNGWQYEDDLETYYERLNRQYETDQYEVVYLHHHQHARDSPDLGKDFAVGINLVKGYGVDFKRTTVTVFHRSCLVYKNEPYWRGQPTYSLSKAGYLRKPKSGEDGIQVKLAGTDAENIGPRVPIEKKEDGAVWHSYYQSVYLKPYYEDGVVVEPEFKHKLKKKEGRIQYFILNKVKHFVVFQTRRSFAGKVLVYPLYKPDLDRSREYLKERQIEPKQIGYKDGDEYKYRDLAKDAKLNLHSWLDWTRKVDGLNQISRYISDEHRIGISAYNSGIEVYLFNLWNTWCDDEDQPHLKFKMYSLVKKGATREDFAGGSSPYGVFPDIDLGGHPFVFQITAATTTESSERNGLSKSEYIQKIKNIPIFGGPNDNKTLKMLEDPVVVNIVEPSAPPYWEMFSRIPDYERSEEKLKAWVKREENVKVNKSEEVTMRQKVVFDEEITIYAHFTFMMDTYFLNDEDEPLLGLLGALAPAVYIANTRQFSEQAGVAAGQPWVRIDNLSSPVIPCIKAFPSGSEKTYDHPDLGAYFRGTGVELITADGLQFTAQIYDLRSGDDHTSMLKFEFRDYKKLYSEHGIEEDHTSKALSNSEVKGLVKMKYNGVDLLVDMSAERECRSCIRPFTGLGPGIRAEIIQVQEALRKSSRFKELYAMNESIFTNFARDVKQGKEGYPLEHVVAVDTTLYYKFCTNDVMMTTFSAVVSGTEVTQQPVIDKITDPDLRLWVNIQTGKIMVCFSAFLALVFAVVAKTVPEVETVMNSMRDISLPWFKLFLASVVGLILLFVVLRVILIDSKHKQIQGKRSWNG
jgi:hypothetical protein